MEKQNTVENLTIRHTTTKLNESVGKIAKAIKKTYGSNDIAGQYVSGHSDTDSGSKPMQIKGKIASKIYGQFASDHINRGKKNSYNLAKKDILSGKEVKKYDYNKEVGVVDVDGHNLKKTMSSVSKALNNRQEAEKQGLTPKEFRTKKYEETAGANRDANEAIRRAQLAKKNKEEKENIKSSGPKSNFVRSLFKKKVGK